jgi:UDP-perosamine 4-acetyltransferase
VTDKQLIMLGAGGHAKVLIQTLNAQGRVVHAALSHDGRTHINTFPVRVMGKDDLLEGLEPSRVLLINGVGAVADTEKRREVFQRVLAAGFQCLQIVHPSVIFAGTGHRGRGVQIMAGAVIQSDAVLSDNVLINTRAVIEHDCCIGPHCHIASGAVLCGQVRLAAGVLVGAGAIIRQGIEIGEAAVVGAGAVVIKNVPPLTTVAGVPARAISSRSVSPNA